MEMISTIKKMMRVSTRIGLSDMRTTLKIDKDTFFENLWDWAEKFNFKIDGDYIIIKDADVEEFINNLDKKFELWKNKEKTKEGKN